MRRRVLVAAVVLSLVFVGACRPIKPKPPPPPLAFSGVQLKLTPAAAIAGAITMAARTGDLAAIYVGARDGQVYRVVGGAQTPVLDVSSLISTAGECGFLGMAFSPDGTKLYVHYSRLSDCATVVAEYTFNPVTFVAGPPARVLLTVPQPQLNHKGGSLLFGPNDGMLYLALGDGGGANDGYPGYGNGHAMGGNAQSLNTLLGKILRIDPTPDPTVGSPHPEYTIPPDNPYFSGGGLPEIWSYGLRNPFRMSFDSDNGDLYIGDVGQGMREEISWAPTTMAHPAGWGANFGWNRREGDVAGPDTSPIPGTVTHPVHAIGRSQGDAAIVSGYVYHGSAIPELEGVYLFADFYHFAIRALRFNSSGTIIEHRDFGAAVGKDGTAAFGEDNAGELYVVSLYSGVWRIDKA